MAGYYGFTLAVCLSICLSVIYSSIFSLSDDKFSVDGFSPNLVCELILWRSGFEFLMGKFRQFLTELSGRNMSVFLFLDNNLSKYQCIFTKLVMCIDIVICFGIANGQISSIFNRLICLRYDSGRVFSFHVFVGLMFAFMKLSLK